MTQSTDELSGTESSGWERGLTLAAEYGPYATLGIGAVLALVGREPGQNVLVTLALVLATAAWIVSMFTVAGERRERQAWVRFYFVGMLILGAVLMVHHPLFFVFPVAGFFQVHLLQPAPMTFLGVFLTSLVVNGLIVVENPGPQQLWIFGIVVAIQTLAIGLGVIGSQKLTELSEGRRRAVMELERALEENKGLHDQLIAQAREAGVSDERQRMAREIHDTIAQGLMGVITQLEAADGARTVGAELDRRLDNAKRIARESLVEARRAVQAATPQPLDGRSLTDALEDVVGSWSEINQMPAEWHTTGASRDLHPELEVTALRVVQEALANVTKHAGATRVGVTLSYMGDVVTVDVRDDGKGFSPNGDPPGFGLAAMQSRVEELSGALQIESEPGRGTAISATLPVVPLGSHDG